MNLVRLYKLHILGISIDPKLINTFLILDKMIKDLSIFHLSKYPNSTYYMNRDGKCIFEKDDITREAYVRYSDCWEVLEKIYLDMDESTISDIFVFWINKEYNLNFTIAYPYPHFASIDIEYSLVKKSY